MAWTAAPRRRCRPAARCCCWRQHHRPQPAAARHWQRPFWRRSGTKRTWTYCCCRWRLDEQLEAPAKLRAASLRHSHHFSDNLRHNWSHNLRLAAACDHSARHHLGRRRQRQLRVRGHLHLHLERLDASSPALQHRRARVPRLPHEKDMSCRQQHKNAAAAQERGNKTLAKTRTRVRSFVACLRSWLRISGVKSPGRI